jgi:hypothetical protein
MSTEAQINANRLNAAKSTGPKTVEGKTAVSQNALKHGLSAENDTLTSEVPAEFEAFRDEAMDDYRPQTAVEYMLVKRVISLTWRLRRITIIQNQVLEILNKKNSTKSFEKFYKTILPQKADISDEDPSVALGNTIINDFTHHKILDRLLMYERRTEHSLQKTIKQLYFLQTH